jgi:hypothetical protein
MEEKANELYNKYLNTHSLMSKNAAKKCAAITVNETIRELEQIPGTEHRIEELKKIVEVISAI